MRPATQRDIDTLKNPDLWPLGHVLPLKRPAQAEEDANANPLAVDSRGNQLGVLFYDESHERWTVYRVNVLQARSGTSWRDITTHDYIDAEGVLDAGWRVD